MRRELQLVSGGEWHQTEIGEGETTSATETDFAADACEPA